MIGVLPVAGALAVAFALGWVLVRAAIPPSDTLAGRVFTAGLAAGLGIGASSCIYAAWIVLPTTSRWVLFVIEGLTLASCAVASRLFIGQGGNQEAKLEPSQVETKNALSPSDRRSSWLLGLCLLGVSLSSLYLFFGIYEVRPDGEWDAWAMYNSRARFLFRDPENWIAAFRVNHTFNPDYPALVSGSVARLWTFASAESTLAPALLGLSFLGATSALLFGALARFRGVHLAILGTLLLLGTRTVHSGLESFTHLSAYQMADVPLAFFILATVVLATCSTHAANRRDRIAMLVLAGLMASLAAWTKNEGLLFVVVFAAALAIVELAQSGMASSVRSLFLVALGAAPVMAIVIAFKLGLAPENYILSADNVGVLGKLTDVSRYFRVLESLVGWLVRSSGGAFLVLFAALGLLGVRRREALMKNALPALVVLLTLAGYSLVFVMTRLDLDWHMRSAQARLLMHIWPSAIFACFLLAKKPGVFRIGGSLAE